MPVYDYHHEESGKTISVFVPLSATDQERAQQMGEDGNVYRRVYAAPLAAQNMLHGDSTIADFRRATTDKRNLSVGEAWDISREMSERRAAKNGGVDPKKEQFYRDYEKRTKSKHHDVIQREKRAANQARMREFGIKLED